MDFTYTTCLLALNRPRQDVVHNLNEVWKLQHVETYKVISYRVEEVPYGVNYYAKAGISYDIGKITK